MRQHVSVWRVLDQPEQVPVMAASSRLFKDSGHVVFDESCTRRQVVRFALQSRFQGIDFFLREFAMQEFDELLARLFVEGVTLELLHRGLERFNGAIRTSGVFIERLPRGSLRNSKAKTQKGDRRENQPSVHGYLPRPSREPLG